jgi:phytol kinase
MSSPLYLALLFLGIFGLLIIFTQLLHRVFKVDSEASRKFLHISGGILSLFFYRFFQSHWWVLLLCLIAFLVLLSTYIYRMLPGIHKTTRLSFGSILFPIPVYLCFLAAIKLHNSGLFYLPTCILTICDPIAEWGGKKWGHKSISFFSKQKTLAGSMCFAASLFLISLIWFCVLSSNSLTKALSISLVLAIVVTLVELISLRGLDNLSIPISALVLLILFLG